jgi:hypothetical protein
MVQGLHKKSVQSGATRNSGARRNIVAAGAALLFLAAQLIATAHVHPWAYARAFSNGAQVAASEASCPVCALHAQTPVSTTNAPVLAHPLIVQRFDAAAMLSRLLCVPKSQLFGRAPPAPV